MSIDPYAQCPCGTGKKVKWCSPKAWGELTRVEDMLQNDQAAAAVVLVDKLLAAKDAPECLVQALQSIRVRALLFARRTDEAQALLDEILVKYENYGLPFHTMASLAAAGGKPEMAVPAFREALARFPAEATDFRARALAELGGALAQMDNFLAAWAAFQRSRKLHPDFAADFLKHAIEDNPLLPGSIRKGLQLKSADELAVFNPERRARWDNALAREGNWDLDDLKSAFEYLANDDANDAAAWYNYALALAWLGDNDRALDALARYADIRGGQSDVADAWEVGEVIRLCAGREHTDNRVYVAIYQVLDPQAMPLKLRDTRRFGRVPDGEQGTIVLMDKDFEDVPAGVPLLGRPPRPLANVVMATETVLLVAHTPERLREAKATLEVLLGTIIALRDDREIPSETVPAAQCAAFAQACSDSPASGEKAVAAFWEEEWIHWTLRSLGGMTPADAAESPRMRPRVEGLIRHLERNFIEHGGKYSFDRLRNRLRMIDLVDPAGERVLPLTTYSAQQLLNLKPEQLSDDELAAAYRSATSLGAERLSLRFAEAMVARPSLADKSPMIPVFRRLVTDRLEHKQADAAAALVEAALDYDDDHYDGANRASLEFLEAKVLLAQGNTEEAFSLYKDLIADSPEELDLAAQVAEQMLSLGRYADALEVSELGLRRAQDQRRRDLQEQFRELAGEAKRRVR